MTIQSRLRRSEKPSGDRACQQAARIAWAVLNKERTFECVKARAAGSAAVRAVAADLPDRPRDSSIAVDSVSAISLRGRIAMRTGAAKRCRPGCRLGRGAHLALPGWAWGPLQISSMYKLLSLLRLRKMAFLRG